MSIEEVIDRAIMAQQSIEIEYCTRSGRVFSCKITDIGYSQYYGGEYQRMLTAISKYEEQGISHENAVYEAFREVSA